MTINPLRESILKSLGMLTFLNPHQVHIDFGHPAFNKVIGNERGMPSGKMYELAGVEHVGKTTLTIIMATLAQMQQKAFVLWIDLEGSWDNSYARGMGMRLSQNHFYLIKPLVVKFSKKSKGGSKKVKERNKLVTFLQTIEWQFKEAEAVMAHFKSEHPDRPIFVACDSVANMQTEEEFTAGATDQNMRTAGARAQFLSRNLPKWTQLAVNYDAWMVFINQIRTNPAQAFGNPEYTPGGRGLAHNAHSRDWLRKIKSGEILKAGKVIGIQGKMINQKNKTGGGSEPYLSYGYKIYFNKTADKALKFMPLKEKKSA